MKTNISYPKFESQINLENTLHRLKESGITISQLKEFPEYAALHQEFDEILTDVIYNLVHEKSLHELITSIARSYTSQYLPDLKEYDTLYEVISETYIGLYNVITKAGGNVNNKGRVRIDTYMDREPEDFVITLRTYIRNNIIMDLARRHGVEKKYVESATASENDGNETFNKLDLVKYNGHNIEEGIDYTDDIIRRLSYGSNTCDILINAVITRFMSKKPVAGYIYLCIMNESYDPMTIVTELKTRDFNRLFHAIIREIELNYNVDLSYYDDMVFNADKYLSSLRNVDDAHARARIDRLASQTRIDVQKIPAFIDAKTNIDINDKYFCL